MSVRKWKAEVSKEPARVAPLKLNVDEMRWTLPGAKEHTTVPYSISCKRYGNTTTSGPDGVLGIDHAEYSDTQISGPSRAE